LPQQLLAYARARWQIENRSHWRRDVTLCEDATLITFKPAAMTIAALNSTFLARISVRNLRGAMRQFAARPQDAFAILISTA